MKVYVCGDIHGCIDISKLNTKNWPEQNELSKEDLLIVLGDFGLIWSIPMTLQEAWWLKWLSIKPFTVAFVDGNHESFELLNSFPVKEKWGGKVSEVYKNVYHLKRGECFLFNDKKVLTIGGATSHDKRYRINRVSWWEEEAITTDDIDKCLQHKNVDFILSHTCPTTVIPYIIKERCNNLYCEDKLEVLNKSIVFDEWYFGHWHEDISINNRYHCFYNDKPKRII